MYIIKARRKPELTPFISSGTDPQNNNKTNVLFFPPNNFLRITCRKNKNKYRLQKDRNKKIHKRNKNIEKEKGKGKK